MNRLRQVAALTLTLAALALAASRAWPALHAWFMDYDDEGYVAYSVAQYRAGLRLYDDVFSQYGPFAFVAADLAFDAAGEPVTTDNIRFATWLALLVTLTALGGLAWWLTRSWWAPAMIPLCGVELVRMSYNEPFHPGHLIAVVLVCGALGIAWAWDCGRPVVAAIVAGVAAGALLLTKINVGVFWLLGAGAVAVQALPVHRTWRWAWFAGWIASPWLLMAPRLDHASMLAFAAGASLGFLALHRALRREVPSGCLAWSAVAWGAAACLSTLLIVCAVVLVRGTSIGALFHAVVMQPLGQTSAWAYAMPWRWETAAPFVVGLFALAATTAWRGLGLAAVRLGVGVAVVVAPLLADQWVTLQVGLAMPALALVGAPGLRSSVWIAALAQMQVLHAYPVAGSQVGWGSLLLLPLATVLILEGMQGLPLVTAFLRNTVRVALPACLLVLAAIIVDSRRAQERFAYACGLATQLPGAHHLRLQIGQHALWSVLAANAARADVLLSIPGLGSLHLWTGTPPAAPPHATQWWALLDSEKQDLLRRGLAEAHDPLVIAHQGHLEFLREAGFGPREGLAVEVLETWPAYARFSRMELRSRDPGGRPVLQLLRWDGTGWVVTLPRGSANRLVAVRAVTAEPAFSPPLYIARSLHGLECQEDGRWVSAELPLDVAEGARLRLPPDALAPVLRAGEGVVHFVGDGGEIVPVLVDEMSIRP